jgi:hypothetical protein
MQESHLYEYAVIRVVPRVEREEFINVGVVLFCKKHKFLQVLYTVDEKRLCSFYGKIDIEELRKYLQGFEKICRGDADGGPIALLDLPSRFRWLTANRSTVLQTSKVHPGHCTEPQRKLQQLFEELVG